MRDSAICTPAGQATPRCAAAEALVIAVLGAESTGKTWLAQALSEHLALTTGLRCTWVPEWLRQWCHEQGRTPHQHEQALIAQTQQARIAHAARSHDIVVADTTALMTAVYSLQVFGDDTLREPALQQHGAVDLTLVTGLDLPWVADGHQRDGPHVRGPVDGTVIQWLQAAELPYERVIGQGAARLQCALQVCGPAVARLQARLGKVS